MNETKSNEISNNEKAMYLVLMGWSQESPDSIQWWTRVRNGQSRSIDSAFRFQKYLDEGGK